MTHDLRTRSGSRPPSRPSRKFFAAPRAAWCATDRDSRRVKTRPHRRAIVPHAFRRTHVTPHKINRRAKPREITITFTYGRRLLFLKAFAICRSRSGTSVRAHVRSSQHPPCDWTHGATIARRAPFAKYPNIFSRNSTRESRRELDEIQSALDFPLIPTVMIRWTVH